MCGIVPYLGFSPELYAQIKQAVDAALWYDTAEAYTYVRSEFLNLDTGGEVAVRVRLNEIVAECGSYFFVLSADV